MSSASEKRFRILDTILWGVAIACGLAFYFSQDWLFHNRPHDPATETGQVWEVRYHGALFFLGLLEYVAFQVLLPGAAIVALVAGAGLYVRRRTERP